MGKFSPEQYAAFLANGRARRDRIIEKAQAEPLPFGKRPRVSRDVDGYRVVMTKFDTHAEHGVRINVVIRQDGAIVHRDEHIIVNPPSQTHDVNGVMSDDPLLAIARTVVQAWKQSEGIK